MARLGRNNVGVEVTVEREFRDNSRLCRDSTCPAAKASETGSSLFPLLGGLRNGARYRFSHIGNYTLA